MQLPKSFAVKDMVLMANTRSILSTSGDLGIMSTESYGHFHVVQFLYKILSIQPPFMEYLLDTRHCASVMRKTAPLKSSPSKKVLILH